MDCIESAAFPDQREEEVDRLMHMIVVGGGPTGVEFSGELHDFIKDDLRSWYPELDDKLKITLVEDLPNLLPMVSRELIQYRPITRDLMAQLPPHQTSRRGLLVDDYLRLLGVNDVYAIGDCTATSYAPTAQVATQDGRYLARLLGQLAKEEALEKQLAELCGESSGLPEGPECKARLTKASKIRPFHYSHQGSLAYIGSDKAIADLPFMNGNSLPVVSRLSSSGGVPTFSDWLKVKLLGRDVSRESRN